MVNISVSKRAGFMLLFLCLAVAVSGCGGRNAADSEAVESNASMEQSEPDISEKP